MTKGLALGCEKKCIQFPQAASAAAMPFYQSCAGEGGGVGGISRARSKGRRPRRSKVIAAGEGYLATSLADWQQIYTTASTTVLRASPKTSVRFQ